MRPIRYGDIRQILTSVADTTVTIVSPTKRHFLITGSASQYWLVLPDARTIRLGTPFVFENQSSEFVGVRNSDSTTWHRVPPRATLTCVLGTQATAAGTWYSMAHDPAVANPAFGLSLFEDWNHLASAGIGTAAAGAAAIVGQAYVLSPPGGRQGILGVAAGTTATGYALAYSPSQYVHSRLGSGCRAVEASLELSVISTAADEYIARFGFGNNILGGAHTEGVYFLYDRLAAGVIYWQMKAIKTAGGAANTQTATTVEPVYSITAALWQKLRVEINSTASRADFFIDNVQVSAGGGLTTLPATTTNIKHLNFGVTQSAYAAVNHYMMLDNSRVQSYPTTPR